MTKTDKEKPRVLDEKTGFIRSGTEGTRTLDLRLDRTEFSRRVDPICVHHIRVHFARNRLI